MTALTAIALFVSHGAAAEHSSPFQLAMMDMMPMAGGGAAQQPTGAMPGMPSPPSAAPAPSGRMGDDMMRMGGATQGQVQPPMPMGQAQQPMSGCPMMAAMMQDMMRRGAMPQGMQGGGAAVGDTQPMGSSAARLEGRIAFLRTELRITGAQAPAWEAFATTLRVGREHLDAARAALQGSTTAADPMERLASFENHLKERTEAIHLTRMAFGALYGQLDETQKRTATTTMLPFIGSF